MRFKIITKEILRNCLSNLLRNKYNKTYEEFSKFINLNINEEQFEEFKTREITSEEINQIVLNTKVDEEKEVERVKNIWNKSEKEIIKTINEITNITIESKNITCYVDPYQKGGYYGEDNITVGTYKNPEDVLFVIAHELFHVFYWKKLDELKITESKMGNEKYSEWCLAETTVHLLQVEPKMREFWKTIKIEIYPELKEDYDKFKEIWENNSFENYLKECYERLIK
jgi:hypothetical protein